MPQKAQDLIYGGESLINSLSNPGRPQSVVALGESGSSLTKINEAQVTNELPELLKLILSTYSNHPSSRETPQNSGSLW